MEQRPAWAIFAEHWWTVEVIYLPWGRFLLAERARGQREIHDETSLTVLRAVERLLLEELRWSARVSSCCRELRDLAIKGGLRLRTLRSLWMNAGDCAGMMLRHRVELRLGNDYDAAVNRRLPEALVNAAANELDEEMLSDVLTAASSDEEMRERSP